MPTASEPTLRIDSGDNALDIIDGVNRLLRLHGLTLADHSPEHGDYLLYRLEGAHEESVPAQALDTLRAQAEDVARVTSVVTVAVRELNARVEVMRAGWGSRAG